MVWDEAAGKDAAIRSTETMRRASLTYFDATPTIGLWEGEQWREPEWEEQMRRHCAGDGARAA